MDKLLRQLRCQVSPKLSRTVSRSTGKEQAPCLSSLPGDSSINRGGAGALSVFGYVFCFKFLYLNYFLHKTDSIDCLNSFAGCHIETVCPSLV